MCSCFMLRPYEIENLERKERKEREEGIYRALGRVGSWRLWLSKGSCCVCERNRKVIGKGERLGIQD